MKTEFWSLQADAVLEGFSTAASGLSATEAEKRLEADGKNRLSKGRGESPLRVFLRQFESPVTLLLLFATVLSILATIALPYTPLGALLGLVPLPASLLAALGLVVVCYMLTAEIAKRWFYRNGNGI